MILVTGSQGLIGRHLVERLHASGAMVREFDFQRSIHEDIRDFDALGWAMTGVEGIVHLAAVSRVVWAQHNTSLTHAINVEALHRILAIAAAAKPKPWIVFVSSREVYGDASALPVREDCPFQPLNVYARSKVRGEELMAEAAAAGLTAHVCRLSSVYGCPRDYEDRVVPAFARTAAWGGSVILAGKGTTLDFTHVQDVAEGLELVVRATQAGEALPTLHFVSGRSVSLAELGLLATSHAYHSIDIIEVATRSYGVARFVGDPSRTKAILGWQAQTPLETGFRRLVQTFRDAGDLTDAHSRLKALVNGANGAS